MLFLKDADKQSPPRYRAGTAKRRRDKEKGVSVFVFGICLGAIVPVIGLAVDLSTMYVAQTRLSASADAATLAAGRSLSRGADSTAQTNTARSTANSYIEKNYPSGIFQTTGTWNHNSTSTGTLWSYTTVDTSQANVRIVTTNALAVIPMMFMRYVGPTTTTIRAMAQTTRRDTNVILVLDRSGSMDVSNSCIPMLAAATAFVDQFALGRDNVGLVTFGASSRIDVAASSAFSTLPGIINQINCVGGTNPSQGLWQAYGELVRINEPNALNVILFFTDGQPTHTTISTYIKSTSTCTTRNTWRTGVIGTNGSNPTGLYEQAAPVIPVASDSTPKADASGCYYNGSATGVSNDASMVAGTDVNGTDVTTTGGTGYSTLAANPTVTHTNMAAVAVNAAYNTAKRIRSGASNGTGSLAGAYIYSIGLGNSTAPPNASLLKDMSNDLNAGANYNAAQRSGLYVYAATANDLNQSFQRVASEILRISR